MDFADLIVGAPYGHDSAQGESYVVFGAAGGWGASLALSSLDGTNGFRIDGILEGDQSGWSVAGAGDVNGDGFADIIIGAEAGLDNVAGESYVVFGAAGGWGASLALSSLDGTNGFRIEGVNGGDHSGFSVASAGDINNDGFTDIIIGEQNGGESYVVFGAAAGWGASLDLSSLNGANGFRLEGAAAPIVASVGDINGDGFADIIVGGGNNIYVVFGAAGGWSASLDLSTLNGSNGFALVGIVGGYDVDNVAGAGDVNGDGFADIIVGDYGKSYVVFGAAEGWGASLDVSSLNGSNGFRLDGAANGGVASMAGDVNGDGFADLIVGNPIVGNGTLPGESYVIFGARPGEAVTRTGTDIANHINGGDFNDTLNGLGGNDTLNGGFASRHFDWGLGRRYLHRRQRRRRGDGERKRRDRHRPVLDHLHARG